MTPRAKRVTPALLARWPLPAAENGGGKEARGRVLAVGGSRKVPGAVLLAGTAALRVGAGKLQIATASEAAMALALAMPEAKVVGLATDARGELRKASAEVLADARRTDALLLGPGMANGARPLQMARAILRAGDAPVVLDAGALHALDAWAPDGRTCIVTPHAGEMAALIDADIDAVNDDARDIALDFARARGVVTVLKGATTHIASPDGRLWTHTGGCAGLGTSGSGDVLAGAIAGLLARGASAEQAAAWAVFLHGQAGERLARSHGGVGFLAREIADALVHSLD